MQEHEKSDPNIQISELKFDLRLADLKIRNLVILMDTLLQHVDVDQDMWSEIKEKLNL